MEETIPPVALCELCQQFVVEFSDSGLRPPKDAAPSEAWTNNVLNARWDDSWGYGFFHHKTIEDLRASASTCPLCDVIAKEYADGPNGEQPLMFFPVDSGKWTGVGNFVATFSAQERTSLTYPYGLPQHMFKFGRRRPYNTDVSSDSHPPDRKWVERDFERAIPDNSLSKDAFDTARFWLNNCKENHNECEAVASGLPTRVIDVGVGSQDVPKLLITTDEKKPYVALTHCWGGEIPCRTLASNIDEYQKQLPMEDLPQNFQDTVRVTRELGLRYVWIDALCIIQDSAEDWKVEAAKMANVYRDAIVTISPLHASKSTDGFLKPRSTRERIINSDFSVRKHLPKFIETIDDCILNTRGWCMQERLLSRALLHFSNDQMFWECRTITAREAGGNSPGNSDLSSIRTYQSPTQQFAEIRRKFVSSPQARFDLWYRIVEEFTCRGLTYGTDKLSAIAGAADQFRSAGFGGQYAAGHWTDDLAKSLFWGAKDVGRKPMMKATGIVELANLTWPPKSRAPTWSWASVDGVISFQTPRNIESSRDSDMKILEANVSVGLDDMTAVTVEGTLKIRAIMIPVVCHPSTTANKAGRVYFTSDADTPIAQAMLDMDRERVRECWLLLSSTSYPGAIIVEEQSPGIFHRTGLIYLFSVGEAELSKFKPREIILA